MIMRFISHATPTEFDATITILFYWHVAPMELFVSNYEPR